MTIDNLIDKLKETKEIIKPIINAARCFGYGISILHMYSTICRKSGEPDSIRNPNNYNSSSLIGALTGVAVGMTLYSTPFTLKHPEIFLFPIATNLASYGYERYRKKREHGREDYFNIMQAREENEVREGFAMDRERRANNLIDAAPVNHIVQNQGYRTNRIDVLVDEEINKR